MQEEKHLNDYERDSKMSLSSPAISNSHGKSKVFDIGAQESMFPSNRGHLCANENMTSTDGQGLCPQTIAKHKIES